MTVSSSSVVPGLRGPSQSSNTDGPVLVKVARPICEGCSRLSLECLWPPSVLNADGTRHLIKQPNIKRKPPKSEQQDDGLSAARKRVKGKSAKKERVEEVKSLELGEHEYASSNDDGGRSEASYHAPSRGSPGGSIDDMYSSGVGNQGYSNHLYRNGSPGSLGDMRGPMAIESSLRLGPDDHHHSHHAKGEYDSSGFFAPPAQNTWSPQQHGGVPRPGSPSQHHSRHHPDPSQYHQQHPSIDFLPSRPSNSNDSNAIVYGGAPHPHPQHHNNQIAPHPFLSAAPQLTTYDHLQTGGQSSSSRNGGGGRSIDALPYFNWDAGSPAGSSPYVARSDSNTPSRLEEIADNGGGNQERGTGMRHQVPSHLSSAALNPSNSGKPGFPPLAGVVAQHASLLIDVSFHSRFPFSSSEGTR